MKKKLIGLSTAAILLGSLVGCGTDADTNDGQQGQMLDRNYNEIQQWDDGDNFLEQNRIGVPNGAGDDLIDNGIKPDRNVRDLGNNGVTNTGERNTDLLGGDRLERDTDLIGDDEWERDTDLLGDDELERD